MAMNEIELKIYCGRCEELGSLDRIDLNYAHCSWCGGNLEDNWVQYSGQGYDFREAGDEQ